MARIAGVNIPQNKLVHIGLTYIYGIGNKFSERIYHQFHKYKLSLYEQVYFVECLYLRYEP